MSEVEHSSSSVIEEPILHGKGNQVGGVGEAADWLPHWMR